MMARLISILLFLFVFSFPAEGFQLITGRPRGTESYSRSNAAADPNGSEANATTGFVAGNATLSSDSIIYYAGSYSVQFEADGVNDASRIYENLSFVLSDGDKCKISFYVRHDGTGTNNGDVAIGLSDQNWTTATYLFDTLVKTDTSFSKYTLNFTYSLDYRYFVIRESNADNDGGAYIDNISLLKY
jgi:hypothetical protein